MNQIILDEQLEDPELIEALHWITVNVITQLRPGTIIKDDAIPALLRHARRPTFITINVRDFWLRRWHLCDKAYCIVCFKLTSERIYQLPGLLRKLLQMPKFRTRSARMGKIALVNQYGVRYIQIDDDKEYWLPWLGRD
jgi:hypothetical protein